MDKSNKGRKPSTMSIGEKLKALRKASGYNSYRSFAKAHELDAKQYWRLEEEQTDFRFSSLRKVIGIHGISLEEFFKGVA